MKKNVDFEKPDQKNPATMRRCFTYLVNLVLKAPVPLSFDLHMNRTTHAQLLAAAEEYSEWYDGVMSVRGAYRELKAEQDG